MVCGWNTGMVVVPTATDELSTSSTAQQSPALTFSHWVNQLHTLSRRQMVSLLTKMWLWKFYEFTAFKVHFSHHRQGSRCIVFPWVHLFDFNSCACVEEKQINSTKMVNALLIFLDYRIHVQWVVFFKASFFDWLFSNHQYTENCSHNLHPQAADDF